MGTKNCEEVAHMNGMEACIEDGDKVGKNMESGIIRGRTKTGVVMKTVIISGVNGKTVCIMEAGLKAVIRNALQSWAIFSLEVARFGSLCDALLNACSYSPWVEVLLGRFGKSVRSLCRHAVRVLAACGAMPLQALAASGF